MAETRRYDRYVGTTLDAVAARAEVSPQTVYNLVGGKATLFRRSTT